MAKGIPTLIRVSEWTVDEKRRVLGARLKELDDLQTGLVNLEQEVVREQRTAQANPELAGFLYGNYADQVIHRREQLNSNIASKENEVTVARDALSEAYRGLKKYEVVNENNMRRAEEELARKEQIELDELGQQAREFRDRQ